VAAPAILAALMAGAQSGGSIRRTADRRILRDQNASVLAPVDLIAERHQEEARSHGGKDHDRRQHRHLAPHRAALIFQQKL
jgi:hypothetical protein